MKSLSPSELAKPRSRRLQKKLRVGEFQELGFEVKAAIKKSCTDIEQLLNDWVDFVEAQGWYFGGGTNANSFAGFLSADGRGSLGEADRESAQNWLAEHPHFIEVEVGALRDCWHGW